MKAATFLINDSVMPSNTERGYVLRRLIRRAIVRADKLGMPAGSLGKLSATVGDIYKDAYPEVAKEGSRIQEAIAAEETRFRKTLADGAKKLQAGTNLFDMYATYGYPVELSLEMLGVTGKEREKQIAEFREAMKKHREISSAGAEKKFGGHGLILNTGELKAATEEEVKIVTRLHTATHLLQSALREVLGASVRQAGSDITAERTRFDFTFDRKLTDEEVQKVEAAVNREIQNDLPVHCVEMPKEEAEKAGALAFFRAKYAPIVKVYFMGSSLESAWSKEFCGGPHVERTGEVGTFKIQKQEAVSAGVRRIRGVLAA
jgi:alanyl-tRNA synthetase